MPACPECGGETIGPITVDVPGAGQAADLNLKLIPDSGMVRVPVRSPVRAEMCTACGHVALRAEPGPIAEAWAKGLR